MARTGLDLSRVGKGSQMKVVKKPAYIRVTCTSFPSTFKDRFQSLRSNHQVRGSLSEYIADAVEEKLKRDEASND